LLAKGSDLKEEGKGLKGIGNTSTSSVTTELHLTKGSWQGLYAKENAVDEKL